MENKSSTYQQAPKILPLKIGLRFVPTEHLYIWGDIGALAILNKKKSFSQKNIVLVFSNELGYQLPMRGGNIAGVGLMFLRNSGSEKNGSAQSFFGLKIS